MLEIRESRIYQNKYATFEAYCRDRWDMGESHSYRLMDSAKVYDNLSPSGEVLPATESQARPLTRLSAPLQIEAWKRMVEQFGVSYDNKPYRRVLTGHGS